MAKKGCKLSDEHKRKIGEANKGKASPLKGKKRPPFSAEWKSNISKAFKGKSLSDEHRKKISLANKGKSRSEAHKERLRIAQTGKRLSKETIEKIKQARKLQIITKEHRENISKALKGKTTRLKGKKFSKETRLKMSIARSGDKNPQFGKKGELSPSWKGGICKEPGYNLIQIHKRRTRKTLNGGSFSLLEWRALKKQYNDTCPICKKEEPEIKLTADHIIPVTKGGSSNITNIQPLCMNCNCKKNTKVIKIAPNGQAELVFPARKKLQRKWG